MKWLKRIGLGLVALLFIAAIFFFFFLGKIADRKINTCEHASTENISPQARKLHKQLLIADLHADNLLWDRNLLERHDRGQVDLPRLQEGNVAFQVFDAVIKTPSHLNYQKNDDQSDDITLVAMANRWPPRTWTSLLQRALYQSKILHRAAKRSNGQLVLIKSRQDLDNFLVARKRNQNLVGGMLSVEGLHALEGDIGNLPKLYDAGYRMLGLVHFFDNAVGGSSTGVKKGGLTDFGKQVVRKMESMDIIIDLAHASPQVVDDVLKIANRPVVVSHTGVQGIHNSPRNLSDRQIRAIAAKGGLIGIGFWQGALGGIHPANIAKSIHYVVDLVGIEHVALGSDFDGAVHTYFDAAGMVHVTEALLQEGFSEEEIAMVMGGNEIRFFQRWLPEE